MKEGRRNEDQKGSGEVFMEERVVCKVQKNKICTEWWASLLGARVFKCVRIVKICQHRPARLNAK